MKHEGSSRQREALSRLVATALLLYALAHCMAAQTRLTQTEALAASMEARRAALETRHAQLLRRLREGEDPETLEERARRELGLVRPGEIVFIFADGEEDCAED